MVELFANFARVNGELLTAVATGKAICEENWTWATQLYRNISLNQ